MTIRNRHDIRSPRLPQHIRDAQVRLLDMPERRQRNLLCLEMGMILLTYTPLQDLCAPIVFNRNRPANVLSVSLRSIDRYLTELVRCGLIVRLPQKKIGPGLWDCTCVQWTKKAISLLFPNAVCVEKETWYVPRCTRLKSLADQGSPSDEHGATNLAYKSVVSPTGENKYKTTDVAALANAKIHYQDERTRKLRALMPNTPIDLIEPALSLALGKMQVVYLMKLCKAAKQRLQDVFTLFLDTLKKRGITGKGATSWLKAVIESKRDFAWLVKERKHEARQVWRTKKHAQMTERVAQALKELKHEIVLPDGSTIVDVADTHCCIRNSSGRVGWGLTSKVARTLTSTYPFWVKRLLRLNVALEKNVHAIPGQPKEKQGDTSTPHVIGLRENRAYASSTVLGEVPDVRSQVVPAAPILVAQPVNRDIARQALGSARNILKNSKFVSYIR